MSRYIDADAFERAVMFSDDEDIQDVIYRLRDYPSADVVEVVRCRNCKHYTSVTAQCDIRGKGLTLIRGEEDFCSRAERRAE